MVKIAFIVVVTLAIIVNVVGYLGEKIYKKKMSDVANKKEN